MYPIIGTINVVVSYQVFNHLFNTVVEVLILHGIWALLLFFIRSDGALNKASASLLLLIALISHPMRENSFYSQKGWQAGWNFINSVLDGSSKSHSDF